MFTGNRLTKVFNSSKEIPFDDSSKFILFSDCHRGDNSLTDDFAHNQNIFFYALNHYYNNGFSYIEIGDGDELWENRRFTTIRSAYSPIFKLMSKFHQDNRFYFIWGNHNRKWKNPKNVKRHLYGYYNEREDCREPLFEGIETHEGLILQYSDTKNKIFLTHGHQGQILNDFLWWVGRLGVSTIWKLFQLIGVKDPTSPAKNFKTRIKVERKISKWAKDNNQIIIAGHTHRSVFPIPSEPPYFNTGSCVHPRCITGIEIQNGKIVLIKWSVNIKTDGIMYIDRQELVESEKLNEYFWKEESAQ